MLNKYLPVTLEALKTDSDLKGSISDELIIAVKRKTKNSEYFRDLYEMSLIDEAKAMFERDSQK